MLLHGERRFGRGDDRSNLRGELESHVAIVLDERAAASSRGRAGHVAVAVRPRARASLPVRVHRALRSSRRVARAASRSECTTFIGLSCQVALVSARCSLDLPVEIDAAGTEAVATRSHIRVPGVRPVQFVLVPRPPLFDALGACIRFGVTSLQRLDRPELLVVGLADAAQFLPRASTPACGSSSRLTRNQLAPIHTPSRV